jgi:GntR family transcriptional regulator
MKPEAPTPAFQPLYRQIKVLLTERLQAGVWGPGAPIPSEIELAQQFGVSQGTVRKAVSELADEQVLIRVQGRGTFVASHSNERIQYAFLRITPDSGRGGEISADLLELRRVKADAAAAAALGLPSGTSVFRLRRKLSIAGAAVLCEEVRLPVDRFPGLTAETVERHHCLLYSMYESAFHVKTVSAEERLKAVGAPDEVAQVLGIAPGAPVLLMERIAYTFDRKPVELRRGYCDTARHHYVNAIN